MQEKDHKHKLQLEPALERMPQLHPQLAQQQAPLMMQACA
jgi:hypothetical protein